MRHLGHIPEGVFSLPSSFSSAMYPPTIATAPDGAMRGAMLARATDRVVESVAGGVSLSVVATHPYPMALADPVMVITHAMTATYPVGLRCRDGGRKTTGGEPEGEHLESQGFPCSLLSGDP